VRIGVREVLDERFEIEELDSREEAVELVRDVGGFDVAIVEMRSRANGSPSELPGAETIRELRRTEPALGIVAHGERPERHLATEAMTAGASAYVSKAASADELRRAVDAALEDQSFIDSSVPPKGSRGVLTRRQRQILQLLAEGHSTRFAAAELEVGEETVKTHTKNILARLGARNRSHAVAIALRESLIE
jgi:two-component system NarL family response regulator